jgi:hypothetical protein
MVMRTYVVHCVNFIFDFKHGDFRVGVELEFVTLQFIQVCYRANFYEMFHAVSFTVLFSVYIKNSVESCEF